MKDKLEFDSNTDGKIPTNLNNLNPQYIKSEPSNEKKNSKKNYLKKKEILLLNLKQIKYLIFPI
jgi:hypothetical protein